MVSLLQRRARLAEQGASTFSVIIVLSLSAMVISSACTLYQTLYKNVYGEVAEVRANEAAVGAMWFAIQVVSHNPSVTAITYPGPLSQGQSISYTVSQNSPGLIQITVSSSVAGAQSSTRRIVAIYSIPSNRVISWSEV